MSASALATLLLTGILLSQRPVNGEATSVHQFQSNGNGNICTDCLAFMNDVSKMLKNETIQDDIVAKLVQMCHILGSKSCADLVGEYGILGLSYLSDMFNSKSVCTTLQSCPSKVPALGEQQPSHTLAVKPNGDPCADCVAYLTDLSILLKNRTDEKAFLKKLQAFCQLLRSTDCSNLVEDYGMAVLSYISKNFVPKTVCTQMTFCPKSPDLAKKKEIQADKILRVV